MQYFLFIYLLPCVTTLAIARSTLYPATLTPPAFINLSLVDLNCILGTMEVADSSGKSFCYSCAIGALSCIVLPDASNISTLW